MCIPVIQILWKTLACDYLKGHNKYYVQQFNHPHKMTSAIYIKKKYANTVV